jgi:hypothetical protein
MPHTVPACSGTITDGRGANRYARQAAWLWLGCACDGNPSSTLLRCSSTPCIAKCRQAREVRWRLTRSSATQRLGRCERCNAPGTASEAPSRRTHGPERKRLPFLRLATKVEPERGLAACSCGAYCGPPGSQLNTGRSGCPGSTRGGSALSAASVRLPSACWLKCSHCGTEMPVGSRRRSSRMDVCKHPQSPDHKSGGTSAHPLCYVSQDAPASHEPSPHKG